MELKLYPQKSEERLGYEIMGLSVERAKQIVKHVDEVSFKPMQAYATPDKQFAAIIAPLKNENELAYACIYLGRYLSYIEL